MALPADPRSAALELVVERFAEKVRRVGRRFGLPAADVDELFQDVRVRLWRARQTGEKISSSPASYVYKTAVSAALDIIRKRQTRLEDPLDLADQTEVSAMPESPEARMEESELAAQVARAVETVTPARRAVVRRYLEGARPDEIARELGFTLTKTRNLLYRGLADVRGRLATLGITGAET
jgi:RNA polymerase sigma-70 factor (ECF subfamily)